MYNVIYHSATQMIFLKALSLVRVLSVILKCAKVDKCVDPLLPTNVEEVQLHLVVPVILLNGP
jgi:hypothetical protein